MNSSVHGISQAKVLEWVAISISMGSFQPKDKTCIFWIAGGFFTTEPPRKPPTRTKKKSCINSRSKPHSCSWINHEHWFFSLFPIPFFLPRSSYILDVSGWIELKICKLGSHFSILQPLNKACAVPVLASVSLLVVQIQLEKKKNKTSWPGQGVSARAPAWIQWFNSIQFWHQASSSLGSSKLPPCFHHANTFQPWFPEEQTLLILLAPLCLFLLCICCIPA